MIKINISTQILDILNSEVERIDKIVKEEAEKIANKTVEDIKLNAPKRKGRYAKSFKIKQMSATSVVVHSPKYYRLIHLLEYGHDMFVNGVATGKRVKSYPHIKKVEEKNKQIFLDNIKERIEDGS